MAVDKLVDSTQLDADLTSVANAIRTKGGTSASLAFPAGFVSAVEAIPTGGAGESNIVMLIQNGVFGTSKWQTEPIIPQMFTNGYFELDVNYNGYTFPSANGQKIFTFGGTINAWSPSSSDAIMVSCYAADLVTNIMFRGTINGTYKLDPSVNDPGHIHFKLYKDRIILLDGTTSPSADNGVITLAGNQLTVMNNVANLSYIRFGNNEGTNANNYYKDAVEKVAFYSA